MKRLFLMLMTLAFAVSCSENSDSTTNQKPVAGFSIPSATIEEGESITVNDLSYDFDGKIETWSWDFGNGETSTSSDPSAITYDTKGSYTVTLTVWDNEGLECVEPYTKTVIVTEKPADDVVQPNIKWTFTTANGFSATSMAPAIDSEGNVALGCDSNSTRGGANFYIVSSAGEQVKGYIYDDVIRNGIAVSSEDIFYFGGYEKNLIGATKSAQREYSFALSGDSKNSSPAVLSDGRVIVYGPKYVYLFPKDLSAITWSYPLAQYAQNTMIVSKDESTIYADYKGGVITALNVSDGSVKWTADAFGDSGNYPAAPAVGTDGTIYWCTTDGSGGLLKAMDPDTGTTKWQVSTAGNLLLTGIALSNDGYLYLGDNSGNMTCYSQSTGAEVWSFNTGTSIQSVPAIGDDGVVYFGNNAGNFYSLNGADGSYAYLTLALGSQVLSSPAIADDGTIYVCANTSFIDYNEAEAALYALTTGATGPMENCWAMRSCNAQRNGIAK